MQISSTLPIPSTSSLRDGRKTTPTKQPTTQKNTSQPSPDLHLPISRSKPLRGRQTHHPQGTRRPLRSAPLRSGRVRRSLRLGAPRGLRPRLRAPGDAGHGRGGARDRGTDGQRAGWGRGGVWIGKTVNGFGGLVEWVIVGDFVGLEEGGGVVGLVADEMV